MLPTWFGDRCSIGSVSIPITSWLWLGPVLDVPSALAVDGAGNVYVAGVDSDNGFRIPPGGALRRPHRDALRLHPGAADSVGGMTM